MAEDFKPAIPPPSRTQQIPIRLGKKRYRLTVETHIEELPPQPAPVVPIRLPDLPGDK